MTIINLTQHASTSEQQCSEPANKSVVGALLTFDSPPTGGEMEVRASKLAAIAVAAGAEAAMIGGAPFFMSALERALIKAGIRPLYAFSLRESIEKPDGKGGVLKTAVFRHIGFVEVGA